MHDAAITDEPEEEGKWDRMLALIDCVNNEGLRAKMEKRNAKFECHPHVALMMADAMLYYMDAKVPLYRAFADIEDNIIRASQVAGETMKDEALRYTCAVADLELLLETFIGRPPMTMQEVRDAATTKQYAFRERRGGGVPVSSELAHSIRTGRIGDPREPGREG